MRRLLFDRLDFSRGGSALLPIFSLFARQANIVSTDNTDKIAATGRE